MRSIKLSSIIICLLLIGLSPQNITRLSRRDQPRLISSAVSPKIGFSQPEENFAAYLDTVALAEGKALFENYCSKCHSTDFVIGGGMDAAMADSLVAGMAEKAGYRFDRAKHSRIIQYLRYVLPSE
ncbi:MAG: hypothetical protein JXQ83_10030 [Candidatus Glassbacteria bacterium]|nr:hypothetical protein [Candidatus Glassbacteria bacterium]